MDVVNLFIYFPLSFFQAFLLFFILDGLFNFVFHKREIDKIDITLNSLPKYLEADRKIPNAILRNKNMLTNESQDNLHIEKLQNNIDNFIWTIEDPLFKDLQIKQKNNINIFNFYKSSFLFIVGGLFFAVFIFNLQNLPFFISFCICINFTFSFVNALEVKIGKFNKIKKYSLCFICSFLLCLIYLIIPKK